MARMKQTAKRSDMGGKQPKRKRPRIDIKNPKFWDHTAKQTFVQPVYGLLSLHPGTQKYDYSSKYFY